ncbi:hypothetical protein EDD21DRAFT_374211 [Dissophora ornata]|nr:hypothetical protein EDD21DRAFT_374211 [Dissophora ornata]
MVPITIHQTSRHAVLVIHAKGVDPLSVVTQISPSQDSIQLDYQQGEEAQDELLLRRVNLIAQPLLQQPLTSAEPTIATIKDCTCSVSSENIVLKFTKQGAEEWQSFQLQVKCRQESAANDPESASIDSAMEIDGEQGQEIIETRVVKFVTTANTDLLQNTIRTTPLWESEGGQQQHVGNIQAKRVAGSNAIQMTAELVSSPTTSKNTTHSS